jgi:hypothetical protein
MLERVDGIGGQVRKEFPISIEGWVIDNERAGGGDLFPQKLRELLLRPQII